MTKETLVSCFCHFLQTYTWAAAVFIKGQTVTFNLTQQGDTNSFPADACWYKAFGHSAHFSDHYETRSGPDFINVMFLLFRSVQTF